MLTVRCYRYCLFCVLVCAMLELTSGTTSCTIQNRQIFCNVTENVPEGTLVFDATQVDATFTSDLQYDLSFTNGNTELAFAQHFNTLSEHIPSRLRNGQLRTRGNFDRENMSTTQGSSQQPVSWTFILMIHGTSNIYQLHIDVIDINDNAPIFTQTMTEISSTEGDNQNVNVDEFVIPIARDPDEEHNSVQNYLLEDDHRGLFLLDVTLREVEDIVRLVSTRPLDREERPSYDLVVIARDGGNRTGRLNVTLTLIDVNDNIPIVGASSYAVRVEENLDIGQAVIDINATDSDSGSFGTLTYSIMSVVDAVGEVTDGNIFSINASTGEINTNAVLDRESNSYFRLNVIVRDGGNSPNTVRVTVGVTVVDVNDNRPEVRIDLNQQTSGKVSENLEVGTSIATMTVTDPDEGENGRFNISRLEDLNAESGLQSQIVFRQNSPPRNNTWDLVLTTSLDRETREDYDLQVTVTDQGHPPLRTPYNFSFSIHDENDNSPVFNTSYNVSVSEGVRIGATVVANIQAYDRDIGTNANLTYSLSPVSTEFPHQELFTIHPTVGNLMVAASLDRESTSELDVEVIATDMGGTPMSGRTSVHVVLTDVNDNAPRFASNTTTQIRVRENLSAGRIHIFSATDPDEPPYANVTYLIRQESNYFRIEPETGELHTTDSLDRERFSNHSIQIGATDNELSHYINITILVDDVNDVRPIFDRELYMDTIPENATVDSVVAVLSVIDPDLDNGLQFSIESGNDEGKFFVNPRGEVVLVSSLDRETTESYTLIISVMDGANQSATNQTRVVITVSDINDHPPQFNQSSYMFYVTEESNTTTDVGGVLAISNDAGQNAIISYQITGGNNGRYFTIHPDSGIITIIQRIDRESNEMFELTVTAEDGGSPPLYNTTSVTVLVRDINDNSPIFNPANVTVSLREDHSLNQVFYLANAMDADEGDNANTTYSIVSSSYGEFSIDPATGGISLVSTLDYETVTSVLVIILAVDSRRSDFNGSLYLNISVEDIDDRLPRFPSDFPTSLTVNESGSSRSVILRFQAIVSPTSPASHFNYTLSNHMDDFTLFTLNDMASLEVVSLDREQRSQYNLNIVIINIVANLSNSKVLEIIVSDANDNPPVFNSPPYSFSVMENSVGAHVGTVEAVDEDDGINSMVRFTLQSASDTFQIDRETGVIRTVASLDYDTIPEHSVVVLATDMGTPSKSTSTTVSISVIDVNDNDPKFSTNQMYVFRVPEDTQIGTTVGTIEASDADSGDFGAIAYSIQAGDEGNHFRIVQDENHGMITVNNLLDRESLEEYSLVISVTDNNNRPNSRRIQGNFTIIVLDVNDNAPVFSTTQVYTAAVRENEPASLIATISARDDDSGTNSRVNYMLGSGNYQNSFFIDHSTGELRVVRTLDYEVNTFYPLEIIAIDNGSPTRRRSVQIFNVTVTNVNDHTPQFTLSSYQFTLREQSPSSSTTIRVQAEDDDTGLMGEVTYRILTQSPPNYFDIDGTSGVIRPVGVLDYEQYSEYRLVVEASDRDPTMLNRRVNQTEILIVLENINDNRPRFLNLPHTIRLSEAVSTNTVAYVASAVDADTDTLQYSIAGGNQDNKFTVNSQTGELFVTSTLDRDDVSRYDVTISVTDGLTTVNAVLSIIVEDVNDNAPVFVLSPYKNISVSERSNVGDVVGRIIATDADEGFNAQLEYSLVEASEYFAIESSSGNLTLLVPLDRDNDSTPNLITLQVRVTDMGIINRNTNVTSVRVFITDVNDSPPIFTRPIFRFTISRDFDAGMTFGGINATDADEGTNAEHLFNIVVSPEGLNLFSLNRTSGEFSLVRSLGEESLPLYQIRVRVVDLRNSMLEDFASVEVIVTDTNDHPPVFPSEKYSINLMESLITPQSVLILTATDDDTGSNREIRYQFGEAQSHFTINQSSGNIVLTDSLDHERIPVFTLLVYAINRNGRNSSTIVNVNVLDVNDNVPQFQDLPASLTISEVPYIGLEILRVNATDPDSGSFGQVSYSLITETARSQFSIDNVTGIVTNLAELTAGNTYALEFEATDGGGNSSRMNITLIVEDHSTQSPNFGTRAVSMMVPENFPINTIIRQINASNRLASPVPIKYQISNSTDEVFTLNETTGELILLRSLDFEQVEAYHFIIESYQDVSNSQYSSYLEVVIVVQNINDNAPVFTDAYVVAMNIRESVGMNSEVAVVQASDEDSENNFDGVTYEITDGNVGGVFNIGPTNGRIVVVRSLDRESLDAYRLIVTATDEGTPSLSATAIVVVRVLDVDDVTPSFRNASYVFRVSENSTLHSIVGVVSAVDADLTPIQLVYNLVSLTASLNGRLMSEIPLNHFEMNRTSGAILLSSSLNRALVDRYELEITVTDGRNTNSTSVVIIVEDSNNNRPTFGALFYSFSIPELSDADTAVFQLTAGDADVGHNGIVRYRLGDDWPSGLFSIDSLTGIVALLEAAPLYQGSSNGVWATGTVIASDLGSVPQSSSATVTVNLFDINNHPPSLMQLYSDNVFDISGVGAPVLNVTASDQDQGENAEISYYISYPQGPILIPFEIDRTTGLITVSGDLSPGMITFTVIAVNENPEPFAAQFILSSTARVEITVNGMNIHTPRFNQSTYEGRVLESEDNGTNIVQVHATDDDDNTVSYSIQSSEVLPFAINANGLVSINGTLDREEEDVYDIVIVATDDGVPRKSTTANVRISVLDVNDNEPVFDKDVFEVSVMENVQIGAEVTIITATDQDLVENSQITYGLNETSVFRIDPKTGRIVTRGEIDREAVAIYYLEISATDNGNPVQSSSAVVLISVEGENEFTPVFNTTLRVFMVENGLSAGSVVGRLYAYDEDQGREGELKFTFFNYKEHNPNDYFYINSSGFIILNVTSRVSTSPVTTSRRKRQATDPSTDSITIETGVRAEDSGANPSSVETEITIFLPNEYVVLSRISEVNSTSSPIVVVIAAVCSAVVLAVIVLIVICLLYRCQRRRYDRNKLYSPTALSETESNRLSNGTFTPTNTNGVIHSDTRADATGTRLTAVPEAAHAQVSTTSDSEPASGIFGDDESESVSGMQSRTRANNPEHVSPSGRHRSPQHSRPPPISRSTSDLAAVVNGHNSNSFLRRPDDEEAHPYTRDQLIAIYAANANLLTNSPSQDSIHMFGSEGGGEADGDIDMDNYMFAKFGGGLDSADEESVVGINNDAYTVSSRGRSSVASRSSGGGIDEGPEDLWRGSRTSGFRPHRVTDVIDEMHAVLSQESLSQSKEKRKPKPLPHMMQFQETSFTKKPTSGSYTRHTGSMQNVRYPDHVGNSQYEGYDGRRSSKSQSQSHYASSGAIYPLSYSSRASELTLPPYRAGEAPPPYGTELSPPMRPVNPPEMRRDSQSSDSDSSEYPAPNPPVTSYGPPPISPQPSLPTTNSTLSLDNPIFQSPLYGKQYKAAKAAVPHPHSGSVPQINMYNAGSVHGSIGQGMDRQQRYNVNNGNLRA